MITNKKVGYYTCDSVEYNSKIHCILDGAKKSLPISWHFNDEVFSKWDFSINPAETMDQLYDLRARQLREQYDYLVLSYSGGADSHNILMSFYRQGLHIDEIVTNWVFDASKSMFLINDASFKQAWNHNAEYELNTREKLQWISDHMPETKITIWDISKNLLGYYLTRARDDSWVLDSKDALNPAANQRYNYFHIKDLRVRVDRKNSVGMICGVDKPQCYIRDNRLYLYFLDKIASNVPMNSNFPEYDNCTLEFFYWSPDSCALLAKQCHLLADYLTLNKQAQPYWIEGKSYFVFRDVRERILRGLLYTTWDNKWFQVDKSTRDWDSEFDFWFMHTPLFNKPKENWEKGLENFANQVGPEYLQNDSRGTVKLISPLYYIRSLAE
jgi:hypothetical protein